MQPVFAKTPTPPYYAVIFTSQRRAGDDGYADMANALEALLHKQPGYLGAEHTRDAHGFGITVSYWRDLASISNWKKESTHLQAQHKGKSHWYAGYAVRIAMVEREYCFHALHGDN